MIILSSGCCTKIFAQSEDCVIAFPVCGNGDLNFDPNGMGIDDFALSGNNKPSCLNFLGVVENQSLWLRIKIKQSGTLGFTLSPYNNNADYDFAVYGPNLPCDNLGSSIRCSSTNPTQASVSIVTGMNGTETDVSEGPGSDGNAFVRWLDVTVGQQYYIYIDRIHGDEGFNLEWTGTALLENRITKAEGGVDLGPDIDTCAEQITLNASVTGGVNYIWNNNSSQTSSTLIVNTTGDYFVEVTNSSGCISMDTINVNLRVLPDIITADAMPNEICEGESITLSGTAETNDGSIPQFEWFFPDGTSAGTDQIITLTDLTPSQSGNFRLEVTNAMECKREKIVSVIVHPLPNMTISGRLHLCETEALLVETVDGEVFEWRDPFGQVISTTSNLLLPNISQTDEGTYFLKITTENGCVDSTTFDVIVEPEFIIQASSNSPVCSNDTLRLAVSSNAPQATYSWYNSQGTSFSNQPDVEIIHPSPDDSGQFLVVGENTISCLDSVFLDIEINPAFFFPDTTEICPGILFTIPQTGEEIGIDTTLTIDYLTSKGCDSIFSYTINVLPCVDISCYGVPSAFTPNNNNENDVFQPLFTPGCTPLNYQIRIFNRWGEKVFETENYAVSWDGKLNDGSVLPGLYLWHILYAWTDPKTGEEFQQELKGTITVVR